MREILEGITGPVGLSFVVTLVVLAYHDDLLVEGAWARAARPGDAGRVILGVLWVSRHSLIQGIKVRKPRRTYVMRWCKRNQVK